MKKWLVFLYPITVILIILTLILFVVNLFYSKEKDNKEKQEKINEKNEIEYKANQTIRVKYHKTGEIMAMDINDYLRGVVPSEMPPSYNIEALKAQALVARTYTYKKMEDNAEGPDADICDNFAHCQAFYNKDTLFGIWKKRGYSDDEINNYWSKINEAVVSTQNEVILYDKSLIKAFFHASSPVKTENVNEIWGGQSLPYLLSVDNQEALDYGNRTSQVSITCEQIINKLKEDDKTRINLNVEDVKKICINEYTASGRVKNIKIGEYIISAEKLRTLFGLKSTNFTLQVNEDNICFNVIGYGHGVGMSQVGANYYASISYNYQDIIKHYYTGIEIVKLE